MRQSLVRIRRIEQEFEQKGEFAGPHAMKDGIRLLVVEPAEG